MDLFFTSHTFFTTRLRLTAAAKHNENWPFARPGIVTDSYLLSPLRLVFVDVIQYRKETIQKRAAGTPSKDPGAIREVQIEISLPWRANEVDEVKARCKGGR